MLRPNLHLLHLSSPALPIGAYAYSQGLEYAIENKWVVDNRLRDWLSDGLSLGVGRLDLPILIRVLNALNGSDSIAMNSWNSILLASRETEELLLEDQQVGAALWRLLTNLMDCQEISFVQKPGYAVAFAVACYKWEVPLEGALEAYCYSWLENQVTAATKLVPLGQTSAQKLLLGLLEEIPTTCATAQTLEDDDIGLSLPGLAMASSHHEYQHTRLFRS